MPCTYVYFLFIFFTNSCKHIYMLLLSGVFFCQSLSKWSVNRFLSVINVLFVHFVYSFTGDVKRSKLILFWTIYFWFPINILY